MEQEVTGLVVPNTCKSRRVPPRDEYREYRRSDLSSLRPCAGEPSFDGKVGI